MAANCEIVTLMTLPALHPLKLVPALHSKVWGGRKLATQLGKALPTPEPYGESWELHDSCRVLNGRLRGRSLGELLKTYGQALVGAGYDAGAGFPLLAKFIDAQDWLSIQVHPDDQQARELEGEPRGKNEAWLVLAAEPDAQLVIGLQPGTDRAQLAEAIQAGTLEALLVYKNVQADDVLSLPAGTVHALGPGILIYEIQQASDRTYRLYDWGRLGLGGKPRDLHIDKGLSVANLASLPQVTHPQGELLIDGAYFRTWRHQLHDEALSLASQGCFQALTCIAGELQIHTTGQDSLPLRLGETSLLPACIDSFTLRGSGCIIRSCPACAPPPQPPAHLQTIYAPPTHF
ncbi:MAG: mannose-6-phosphate isomerase [Chloroflexi bacterium]|nr:mannose-6-phosphate isomerase [Chloroflexota bacterium]